MRESRLTSWARPIILYLFMIAIIAATCMGKENVLKILCDCFSIVFCVYAGGRTFEKSSPVIFKQKEVVNDGPTETNQQN